MAVPDTQRRAPYLHARHEQEWGGLHGHGSALRDYS